MQSQKQTDEQLRIGGTQVVDRSEAQNEMPAEAATEKPVQFNLLVVEDDPDDIFLIREALEAGGFTGKVMMAIDGQEALEYMMGAGPFHDREFFPAPELVLLDLNLPKRNGFEVLQFLRKHRTLKRLPVVVLTTSPMQADIDLAYELGANGYLQKPGNFNAFIESLKRLQMMWGGDFRRPTLN